MVRLNKTNLPLLAQRVPVPRYDRDALTVGIVHIGVGGFHRAHQAVYIDRLLQAGASDWAICGVGTLPSDRRMREVLAAQDHLYTVVEKHPDGAMVPRVIGSVVEYLLVEDDVERAIERMTDPATRIVSLTITEGGYALDPVTGDFAPSVDVLEDVKPGATPRTVFGLVTEALRRRAARGTRAFTVMSCDNIEGNGDVARRSFSSFARLRDNRLADWIEQEVSFPNSMVDRITPQTADWDRELLEQASNINDAWPVVCEPFTQWVLEDSFGAGRPPLEDVGVQLVKDVRPYEAMKLRLLNAGHQVIAYLGYLAGHRYVHEAAQDPDLSAYVLAFMRREAMATLEPVPGVDLEQYTATLLARFANPAVRDTLARICTNTSDRIPKFLLPVVRDQLAAGRPVELSALAIAGWARYAEGVDEHGEPIEVVDPLRSELTEAAAAQRTDTLAFLQVRSVFGDLANETRFVSAYTSALRALHQDGVVATVRRAIAKPLT